MQVIYSWAFLVAPALCPSVSPSPHWKSGGARAAPGYMAPALLMRLATKRAVTEHYYCYLVCIFCVRLLVLRTRCRRHKRR